MLKKIGIVIFCCTSYYFLNGMYQSYPYYLSFNPLKEAPAPFDELATTVELPTLPEVTLEPLSESCYEDMPNPDMLATIRDTLRSIRYFDWEYAHLYCPEKLLFFYCTPKITFSDYFKHCVNLVNCSDACCVVALILICKFIAKEGSASFNRATIHKIFLIALFIATNIIEDRCLTMSSAASIGCIGIRSFKKCWITFLQVIDYDFEGLIATTEHILKNINWDDHPIQELLVFLKYHE